MSKRKTSAQPNAEPAVPRLLPDIFTIHVIDMNKKKKKKKQSEDSDDEEDDESEPTPAQVKRMILKDYPLLLSLMKRGDAVENLSEAGYRSSGIYFVDGVDAEAKKVTIVDRFFDFDEYGSQPANYTTPDEFPPDYFNPDNAQYNDMYHPGNKGTLYWHADDGWNIIPPHLVSKIKRDDNNKGTLKHAGQLYRFENLSEGMTDDGYLFQSGYDTKNRIFL